jgi:predicted nuclease with TOPRIM domain
LNIRQGADNAGLRAEVKSLTDLYAQNQKIITSRDESIKEKEDRIRLLESVLSKFYDSQVPFKTISEEAKIIYEGIEQMSYYKQISTSFNKLDSIHFNKMDSINVFSIKWKNNIKRKIREQEEQNLKLWLKKRLELDTLKVVRE